MSDIPKEFKNLSQEKKVKIYILVRNIIKMREAEKNFIKCRDVVNNLKDYFDIDDIDLIEDYVDKIEAANDLDISNFVLNVLFKESE